MYNKRKFNKINDKKVLHKVKKQWVTISLALFMMIGGGAVTAHINASADATNNQNQPQVSVKLGSENSSKNTIINKAKALHQNLLSKASVNNKPTTNKSVHKQINTTHQGNLVTVNNKPAKKVNNINKVGMHKANLYHGYVYNRINKPFRSLRINHTVALHSSISLNSGHIFGYLHSGKTVKANRMFKQFGHYGNYLRYEINLANKHTAFITGNNHFVSYVAPTTNYRYYRNKINYILNHSNNKFSKIRKLVNKLSKRKNRNYSKYMDLYIRAYNTQQNLRHPVVVDYNNQRNYKINKNNNNAQSNLVNSLENNGNTVSASSISVANNSIVPTSASVNPTAFVPYIPNVVSLNSNSKNSVSAFASATTSKSVSINNSASASVSSLSLSASNSAKAVSYAQSAANSADSSIINSYENSVSVSVSIANQSRANSAASSADKSIENSINSSIANSYIKSTENTLTYKKSVSIANSKSASLAAQSADNSINNSIANSAKNSADSKIAQSVSASVSSANINKAKSAQQSADNSIANSYKNSISNSVLAKDSSIASSAASSADKSIANSESASASSQAFMTGILTQMRNKVFSDINNDRKQNGNLPVLKLDSGMNKIANMRAQQLASNFSHYDNQGRIYYIEDSHKLNVNLSNLNGENIGTEFPGILASSTGNDVANTINHEMMYSDSSSNWGHRKNILNPNYKLAGIGTYYDGNGNFYISEDFEGNNYPIISNNPNNRIGTYNGLNYTYNPSTKSLTFINGSLNNGNIGLLYGSNVPSDITNATSVTFDNGVDTSKVNNMNGLLAEDPTVKSINLGNNFDTSNVKSMKGMFSSDNHLESLILSDSPKHTQSTRNPLLGAIESQSTPYNSFDTSNVSDMSYMFSNDSDLSSLTLSNAFNTHNVSNMSNMFHGDSNLKLLEIKSSDTKFNSDAFDANSHWENDKKNSINLGDGQSHTGLNVNINKNINDNNNNGVNDPNLKSEVLNYINQSRKNKLTEGSNYTKLANDLAIRASADWNSDLTLIPNDIFVWTGTGKNVISDMSDPDFDEHIVLNEERANGLEEKGNIKPFWWIIAEPSRNDFHLNYVNNTGMHTNQTDPAYLEMHTYIKYSKPIEVKSGMSSKDIIQDIMHGWNQFNIPDEALQKHGAQIGVSIVQKGNQIRAVYVIGPNISNSKHLQYIYYQHNANKAINDLSESDNNPLADSVISLASYLIPIFYNKPIHLNVWFTNFKVLNNDNNTFKNVLSDNNLPTSWSEKDLLNAAGNSVEGLSVNKYIQALSGVTSLQIINLQHNSKFGVVLPKSTIESFYSLVSSLATLLTRDVAKIAIQAGGNVVIYGISHAMSTWANSLTEDTIEAGIHSGVSREKGLYECAKYSREHPNMGPKDTITKFNDLLTDIGALGTSFLEHPYYYFTK